ncbi:MAG TPA: hypothetical protein VMH00_04760 [Candidatus Limnocylindrales bacterium]|nr:hypothetical protein [Candidatus Limnocylindrales bacterium]
MKTRRAVPILLAAGIALIAGAFAPQAFAQDTDTVHHAKQVLGLEGIKHNTTGTLTIDKGTLEFSSGALKADVPATSITEVLMGADTQRTIGGTIGTLTMFAPYGSGRFLSLFRTKIDTLSITYVDASGGVHGAVFTMPSGKVVAAKTALLAQGAKTSVPMTPGTSTQPMPSSKPQERKP